MCNQEADLDEEEVRQVEELRARRDQLQGMVDENDFDMDELRMLGVHIEGTANTSAAFERIFDDDLAAEESKAMVMRHQKTAQLFASSAGFVPLNRAPRIIQ